MAISKIQIEKLRHNKVDQYAHSIIREYRVSQRRDVLCTRILGILPWVQS